MLATSSTQGALSLNCRKRSQWDCEIKLQNWNTQVNFHAPGLREEVGFSPCDGAKMEGRLLFLRLRNPKNDQGQGQEAKEYESTRGATQRVSSRMDRVAVVFSSGDERRAREQVRRRARGIRLVLDMRGDARGPPKQGQGAL